MKKLVFLISVFLIFTFSANAQGWLKNLGDKAKDAAKRAVENRVETKAEEATDNAMDKAEESVKKTGKKSDKKVSESTDENTESQETKEPQEQDNNVSKENKGTTASLQSYSKFDFVPGEKVIFFDDFSQTAVGDFPPNWNTNASGEVVTTNLYEGNWFKIFNSGTTILDEGINLPENFTVEFDAIVFPPEEGNNYYQFGFYMYNAANPKDMNEGGAVPGTSGIKISLGSRCDYSAYIDGAYTIDGQKEDAIMKAGQKYHLSFWVQKTRLRIYLDDKKVFDLPKVFPAGFKCNMLRYELWDNGNPMITNFRVAAGQPDMRSKLITEGKLVTYGIYFDVNKDVVKPESYGTLKDIAQVLKDNPTVRVNIVGHTDSDGSDKSNLDLSKRRSTSVKNELVKTFGIDASRLESDGMGETKPIAPNDTPANKAQNRRVELIKIN